MSKILLKTIANRKYFGFTVLALFVIILAIGWYLDAGWYNSLVSYANDHGGYTFVLLGASALVSGFSAFVHRSLYSVFTFLFIAFMFILAAVMGSTIGA